MGEGEKVFRRAGIVAGFTLMSRVLGYARDAVLASVFGASAAYDAFVVAHTVPNFLRRLVAEGSLVIVFVPLLAEEKERGGVDAMRAFTSAVLGLLLPFLSILVALGMLFPDAVVTAFAPGFDAARAAIASDLTRIMMGYIVFISLVAVAGGALNTEGRFAPTAAAPIFLNIGIIGFAVLLRHRFDRPIDAVAWGVLVGGALQLLLQIPFVRSVGLLVRPAWNPKHPSVRLLLQRMLPAVFGVAVYQINVMVIRQIGSFLPTGQLSYYYNATRLQEFALGVFAVSVSVAALPTLSEHAAKSRFGAFRATYRRALRVTNFVTIPAMFGLVGFAGPIVSVLFQHGRFTVDDARATSELLQILSVALVAIGAVRVTVPVFYALGDTRTPVFAATCSLAVTFIAGHLLKDRFEIHGLCAATTAAALAQLFFLWGALRWLLRRHPPAPEEGAWVRDESVIAHALKCTLAILPGAGIGYVLQARFGWTDVPNWIGALVLFPAVAAIAASYGVAAKLLKIAEVDLILGAVMRKLGRAAR